MIRSKDYKKNLIESSSINLNLFFSKLKDYEILQLTNEVGFEYYIFIYYNLNKRNSNKLLRVASGLRKEIIKIESIYNFLTKLDPIFYFDYLVSVKDIQKNITNGIYLSKYISEFFVLNKKGIFIGTVKFLDFIYVLNKESTILEDDNLLLSFLENNITCLFIGKTYERSDVKADFGEIIDIHKVIILNNQSKILGAVNIDYVIEQYDIYKKLDGSLYVIKRQNLMVLFSVSFSNLFATIITCILTYFFNFHESFLIMLMLVKCLNDILLLILIGEEIENDYYISYIFYFILFFSLITFLIFLFMYPTVLAIIMSFTLCFICSINAILMYQIYQHINQYLFWMIFIPEIITILCSKVVNLLYDCIKNYDSTSS